MKYWKQHFNKIDNISSKTNCIQRNNSIYQITVLLIITCLIGHPMGKWDCFWVPYQTCSKIFVNNTSMISQLSKANAKSFLLMFWQLSHMAWCKGHFSFEIHPQLPHQDRANKSFPCHFLLWSSKSLKIAHRWCHDQRIEQIPGSILLPAAFITKSSSWSGHCKSDMVLDWSCESVLSFCPFPFPCFLMDRESMELVIV